MKQFLKKEKKNFKEKNKKRNYERCKWIIS
jgi:hypothetical protein